MAGDVTMRQRSGAQKVARKFEDAAQFLKSWAGKPLQIGSVTPSSRTLSKAIAVNVDLRSMGPVIEIGPGTGPITEALVERGIAESRLVLVEYDEEFCALLRKRFPKATVIQGDAYALKQTLAGLIEPGMAAAAVCGLPLITKPEPMRLDLLAQAFELMQPNAPFVQFTYSMLSPIPLKNAFFTAHGSPRIWRNVPPARVWVYRKPVKN
jgi:phosphatidylethanolamine/phosphatidyl-N-methylethanolamine N-methyltransferase